MSNKPRRKKRKVRKKRIKLSGVFRLLLIIFIIVKALPIDPITKELLIIIAQEFIPDIADAIIYASKNMLTVTVWLVKKLKALVCN